MRRGHSAPIFVLVALLALWAPACTRAHAKTAPVVPDAPLDVPPAPPRDIEPTDVEPPQPARPEPPPAATPAPRPRPPAPRDQPRPEPPKPEPPPEQPKPPEEAPPPRGAGTLQTTPTTAEGELERSVRATLNRATSELNRVDYRGLNSDARTQYDTAKRFIRQAEEAIKAKNLVFAKNLADKAATISAQLRTR